MRTTRKPNVQIYNTYNHTWNTIEFNTTVAAHNYYVYLFKFHPPKHLHLDYGQVAVN